MLDRLSPSKKSDEPGSTSEERSVLGTTSSDYPDSLSSMTLMRSDTIREMKEALDQAHVVAQQLFDMETKLHGFHERENVSKIASMAYEERIKALEEELCVAEKRGRIVEAVQRVCREASLETFIKGAFAFAIGNVCVWVWLLTRRYMSAKSDGPSRDALTLGLVSCLLVSAGYVFRGVVEFFK
jgi:hypothetical protein